MSKKIVTIQDISCYGQCSSTVALPLLSSQGIETAILPSGILSTHTSGFNEFTFLDLTNELTKIINHWKKENIKFDAIYTGYLCNIRQFDLIINNKNALLNEKGKLIVDPAIADNGTLYTGFNQDTINKMKNLITFSDLILPNLTEASFLLNRSYKNYYTKNEIIDIAKSLHEIGAKEIVLTGVSYKNNEIGAIYYNGINDNIIEYFTNKQNTNYHGTGDIFSSIYIANYLNNKPPIDCLKNSCEFIVKSIKKTINNINHSYGVMFEQVLLESLKLS